MIRVGYLNVRASIERSNRRRTVIVVEIERFMDTVAWNAIKRQDVYCDEQNVGEKETDRQMDRKRKIISELFLASRDFIATLFFHSAVAIITRNKRDQMSRVRHD